jgi:3-dehydroquinate dehydratase II
MELRTGDRQWHLAVMNGPNLSNLGRRDRRTYGAIGSIDDLDKLVTDFGELLGISVESFVSNYEGALLEFIHESADRTDGYLINPAGLTTQSEGMRHAFQETRRPVVELHFANIATAGLTSVFTPTMTGLMMGLREHGYLGAMLALVRALDDETFLGPTEQSGETNRPDGWPWDLYHSR